MLSWKPGKDDLFYKTVHCLPELKDKDEFDKTVARIRKKFPNANKWLDCHLDPRRAEMIFPAIGPCDDPMSSRDTNAQESLSADFMRSASAKKPSLLEASNHALRYTENVEADYIQS